MFMYVRTYHMENTHPLSRGTVATGDVHRIGLKKNLQPKLNFEWLKKDAVTMGLSKI